MNLYNFYWDCGGMGDLEGLFAATKEQVDAIIGKRIYFGEVLGKHSEISRDISNDDLTILAIDESVVDILVKAVGRTTISGFNPLDYYENFDEEDEGDEL